MKKKQKRKSRSCFRTSSGRPLARPFFGTETMIAVASISRGDAVVTLTPREFKARQAALYEAAVRFAGAHAICDDLDARCDGSEEKITDAEYYASTELYNETKSALMTAYRNLIDAPAVPSSHRTIAAPTHPGDSQPLSRPRAVGRPREESKYDSELDALENG